MHHISINPKVSHIISYLLVVIPSFMSAHESHENSQFGMVLFRNFPEHAVVLL